MHLSMWKCADQVSEIHRYGIIALPTGIVSAELVRAGVPAAGRVCPECGADIHDKDARHCKFCGSRLEDTAIREQ